jgi:hypothetical protein
VEHANAMDFARLSKSHVEMSDHIVVLTAIVGAMVTSALTQSGDSQLAWVVRVCAHGTDGMRDSGLFGQKAA